jgi:hypothetical protein
MSFDKIFSMMHRLNENRFGPGKGKVVAGDSKLVAVPIDRDSLKVKLVGDMQDYIVSGRLTKSGFDGIINWLNQQPDIADYYYKLKDLKTYFIVYEILQDREDALIGKDKQVFKFTIAERKAVPALNPAVSHVTQEEVELIRSGGGAADLTIPVGTKALDGGTSGTSGVVGNTAGSLSVEQIKAKGGPSAVTEVGIKDNVDPKVVGLLTTAYNLIKGDATAGSHPGMPKVKAELQADKLGAFSQAFVYALNSGFGILDAKFQETPDTGINTSLISKILTTPKPVKVNDSRGYFLHPNGYSLIKEEASSIIGFDTDAFVASFTLKLEAMKTKTGDIVVPPEGFKFDTGTIKNPELAKFQTILKANLPTYMGGALAKVPVVTAFIKATADGGYGTRTQALVAYLKDGLSDPKYPDNDKTTIKPDFVRRMLIEFKLIKESNSYRGLGSRGLIREGFDTGAAADSGGTVVTPKKVVTPKVDKDGKPVVVAKKEGTGASGEYFITNYVNQTFKNVVGQAYVKKKGEKDWKLVTDLNAIKAAVNSDFNKAIKADKDSAWYWLSAYPGYRFAKMTGGSGWMISINGKANEFKALANTTEYKAMIDALNKAYGGTSTMVAGKTVKEMYDLQKWVANTVKNYFTGSEFDVYTGNVYDDNNGALVHFQTNLWPPLEKKLAAQDADIKLVQDATQRANLTLNQRRLRGIRNGEITGTTNSLSFGNKMLNDFGTTSDIYSIELKDPTTGSNWVLNVDTDFG